MHVLARRGIDLEERRMSRQNLQKNQLLYSLYYYTNEGEIRLNFKSFLVFGLATVAPLMIMSVDQLFKESNYIGLAITTIVFILLLFIIRRLNRSG